MSDPYQHLAKIGFRTEFIAGHTPEALDGRDIARVVAVHKDSYTVNNGQKDVQAEVVGKLVYGAQSPLDYPTVGDWVVANFYDETTFSIIHEVLPRKTLLKRKTPGKKIDFQLIAANIDTAFIVQSLDGNYNLRRLERYLVMANESHIHPIVLLSKSDLLTEPVIAQKVAEIEAIMPQLEILPFSNLEPSGLEEVQQLLTAGRTYCLLGSSGVGKTTLLNHLVGEAVFKTKSVRTKDAKGRHATTARQLIQLNSGAMIVDTPGMRELGNFGTTTGLDETFAEITALSEQCQFSDCSHTTETGCAVIEAVRNDQLSEKRYINYIKMNKEQAYNEMSYLEKRRKDKQFGKMVKDVMKIKKQRSRH